MTGNEGRPHSPHRHDLDEAGLIAGLGRKLISAGLPFCPLLG
jgi:hypothetical protein